MRLMKHFAGAAIALFRFKWGVIPLLSACGAIGLALALALAMPAT